MCDPVYSSVHAAIQYTDSYCLYIMYTVVY